MSSSQYIVIAKIGKPHGLKGEFNFHLYSHDADDLNNIKNYFVKKDNNFILLSKVTFKIDEKRILAKIDGYNNIDDIKTLCNEDIYIKKEDLPQLNKDEYFCIDLIGCQCYYQNKMLGVVKDVVNYGSSDIFEVEKPDKKLIFIPFLYKNIIEINIEKKSIHFKNLEGFI